MKAELSNRLVVIDCETTGLSIEAGHRIIEIGCVEMIDRKRTGNKFHAYLNPDRFMEEEVIRIHGITNEELLDKPRFKDIAKEFIEFITGSQLVIHNAPFDIGFLNNELSILEENLGRISDYCTIFDTLSYAENKHPGQRNNLDALCRRYHIDNSHRTFHGALLDAEILSDVAVLLTGGQESLFAEKEVHLGVSENGSMTPTVKSPRPVLRVIKATPGEIERHIQKLKEIKSSTGSCVWASDIPEISELLEIQNSLR
ncbi:DNA polymerase III subunit epsilon (plasmid) [Methylomarinum sp. Ch1-1]|uniref:DNA polymerase III subunit epsilon n=1 Tax=Methylomarinum roseum TaxID=3067653 RepID=A0AAU7P0J7_9GAMM|nr:DNA polymerase III subunit epsilon [Methylomarinum sp. Ch1-1]MDP4518978.1 DNA polymerase III subunit epsilon [Methylomarinum sp. Ch1-1]MDP4523376.1 DNA polymerase III subunit epsilon [Methylomarinum sp. Ch1-1]